MVSTRKKMAMVSTPEPEKLVKEFPQRKKRAASDTTPGKSRVKRAASSDGNTLSVSQSQVFSDGISPESQKRLLEFDLDINYGPCCGISRSERYERAVKFGMNPPPEIKHLLSKFVGVQKEEKPGGKKERTIESCIWEGRV